MVVVAWCKILFGEWSLSLKSEAGGSYPSELGAVPRGTTNFCDSHEWGSIPISLMHLERALVTIASLSRLTWYGTWFGAKNNGGSNPLWETILIRV